MKVAGVVLLVGCSLDGSPPDTVDLCADVPQPQLLADEVTVGDRTPLPNDVAVSRRGDMYFIKRRNGDNVRV